MEGMEGGREEEREEEREGGKKEHVREIQSERERGETEMK